MEFLLATGIGVLVASGVYLLLRARTFSVVLGLALISYAVNLFLFAMGRLVPFQPPVIAAGAAGYADPLPQALVLTAIVINLGMTALLLALAVRARFATQTDHVDGVDDLGRAAPGGEQSR
ncbi:MAG: Na+/H+ antiporter subunit C [Burkholderiales bacterium]